MTKSIIFSRVSTKEQAEEGYSLQSQIKLLNEYAVKHQLDVIERYIVPESARGKHERKMFNSMMKDLQNSKGATILLCEKVDRISRNLKDAVILNDWLDEDENRQIHFVKQGLVLHKNSKSNEKFQWDIQLVLARQYSNNLSEEVQKGTLQKAEEGWCPASRKRGYITVGTTGKKTWQIDESDDSQAPYIRRVFQLYNTGEYTLKSLSKQLYEEGWHSHNKPIGKTSIHKILSDCFYCGEFIWNGKHYINANHDALVSKEVFYSVKEKLNRKISGKYRKHNFLFKGICTCAECGRTIVGEKQKGHSYYKCTRHNTSCSQRKYTKQEVLEAQILDLLKNLQCTNPRMLDWVRKALKEAHKNEIADREIQIAKFEKKKTQMLARIDALYEDKLDKSIDTEFYKKKHSEYSLEVSSIQSKLNKIIEINEKQINLGSTIFELAQASAKVFEQCPNEAEKRNILNSVFSNLQIKDGVVLPTYQKGIDLIAKRAKSKDWLGTLTAIRTYGLQLNVSRFA